MAIPLRQAVGIGTYLVKQHLLGRERYPLVLMLEPLFRCNLACAGCGKIDYPDSVLNSRLSVEDCLEAARECGAPCVTIAGGEPLLHREIEKIVEGLLAQGRYVILCTNALLLERNLDRFKPHPNFNFSVHLDGGREEHDHAVCQPGTYDIATTALKAAKDKGFRVSINCTLFDGADPQKVAEHFDTVMAMGAEGFTVSPGYAYERAPDTEHFLSRRRTKELFRSIFQLGKQQGRKWSFTQSSLFLDFLAGNQTYACTPWAMPCRNVFGWQRPCYLLGEGYAKTYRELMDTTDWDSYGVGNYEKCANCMVHCGFEGTAVKDMLKHPWKTIPLALSGPRTDGEFAPEIPLDKQRPAQDVFETMVGEQLATMTAENRLPQRRKTATG
jgi:hopanoid biosynthesis associated radical SAM protein HpnH